MLWERWPRGGTREWSRLSRAGRGAGTGSWIRVSPTPLLGKIGVGLGGGCLSNRAWGWGPKWYTGLRSTTSPPTMHARFRPYLCLCNQSGRKMTLVTLEGVHCLDDHGQSIIT